MSTTRAMANGPASSPMQTNGRRSASLERHRRQSSNGYKGGDVSMVKLIHSRSPSRSSAKGNVSGTHAGQSVTPPVGAVAPPPMERLLPSPPLTPVASVDNLREASAKEAAKTGLEPYATAKSGKSKSKVTSDRTEISDAPDVTEHADGVDTGADGALSTSSSRPDGVTEASATHLGTGSDGGDDGSASATASALAQPSGVVAFPQSSEHNIPQEPTPPQEDQDILDPLSGTDGDVSAEGPSGSSYHPERSPPGTSSSSMPPGHEASSLSPMPPHSHPLYNGPSPQPWDLINPPPNNNVQMEERMRRVRKESNRSMPGSVANVLVKDGKKYRIPHSSYYFGPPADTSAFGTDPIGHIGVHHPREIVRIERDYSGGELAQFSPAYPLELEGRITPTQFLETINAINETLLDAHSLRWSFLDNTLAVLTLYISRLFITSNYGRKMRRLKGLIDSQNKEVYNPVGLNILWPKDVAFMFLEIEYY